MIPLDHRILTGFQEVIQHHHLEQTRSAKTTWVVKMVHIATGTGVIHTGLVFYIFLINHKSYIDEQYGFQGTTQKTVRPKITAQLPCYPQYCSRDAGCKS